MKIFQYMEVIYMSEKEKDCKCKCEEKVEVTYEAEKNVDPTKECDPSNPDYPWVSCGLDKKDKKDKKEEEK